MKSLILIICAVSFLTACNSGPNKEAEALKAKQVTIDSMKAVIAKQAVIDSMNAIVADREAQLATEREEKLAAEREEKKQSGCGK
jgi:PBP1b-binding outer membrane lipoprotein LpoB